MIKVIPVKTFTAFIALVLGLSLHVRAQDQPQTQQVQARIEFQVTIERTLHANEPDWVCRKYIPEGESGPGLTPRRYNFSCHRKGEQMNPISGSIYVLDSRQQAIEWLDRSQMMLQINESKPEYGVGEQAYAYVKHGLSWITFRNRKLFGQVQVGLVDPRTVADPSPEMDDLNRQAFDIAKRFAFHLAQYEPRQ